jgi:hypothetical protein
MRYQTAPRPGVLQACMIAARRTSGEHAMQPSRTRVNAHALSATASARLASPFVFEPAGVQCARYGPRAEAEGRLARTQARGEAHQEGETSAAARRSASPRGSRCRACDPPLGGRGGRRRGLGVRARLLRRRRTRKLGTRAVRGPRGQKGRNPAVAGLPSEAGDGDRTRTKSLEGSCAAITPRPRASSGSQDPSQRLGFSTIIWSSCSSVIPRSRSSGITCSNRNVIDQSGTSFAFRYSWISSGNQSIVEQ